MCEVADQEKIILVIQDIINRGQIAAHYFTSSRSVAFDQQANAAALDNFIADLEGD
jgi:hypothetical protein